MINQHQSTSINSTPIAPAPTTPPPIRAMAFLVPVSGPAWHSLPPRHGLPPRRWAPRRGALLSTVAALGVAQRAKGKAFHEAVEVEAMSEPGAEIREAIRS